MGRVDPYAAWAPALTDPSPADDKAKRYQAYQKTLKLVSQCLSDLCARVDLTGLHQFKSATLDVFKQADQLLAGLQAPDKGGDDEAE